MKNTLTNLAILEAHRRGYRVLEDGKLLNPLGEELHYTSNRKYRYFTLNGIKDWSGRSSLSIPIHKFSAFCKYGETALGALDVRHLNGNSHDNRFSNLALGTRKQNFSDMPIELKRKMTGLARKASPLSLKGYRCDGWP